MRIFRQIEVARHNEIGKRGEDLAGAFLQRAGYELLARNWRYRRAELDLVVRKDDILIFVEVKTRNSDLYGSPEIFVTSRKEDLMLAAAKAYMEEVGHEWEIRFDIITVILRSERDYEIRHFKDAFFPGLEG
ncbi:MAG: YraN family protein [Saprospiraceae bacterium]|nr:YraN family protein [Saprospiraceae bacterium]